MAAVCKKNVLKQNLRASRSGRWFDFGQNFENINCDVGQPDCHCVYCGFSSEGLVVYGLWKWLVESVSLIRPSKIILQLGPLQTTICDENVG